MPVEAELVRRISSEEVELAERRRQLAALISELADNELSLASTEADLAAFKGLYFKEVGALYVELDDLLARIAELKAEREGTNGAKTAASDARRQAEETASSLRTDTDRPPEGARSPELRSLYREVVRVVHPDRASGEADPFLRERLTKKATDAYARADEETLRGLIDEYGSSPESVQGVGTAADLLRITLHIQQIRRRLEEIDQEIAAINDSPIPLRYRRVQSNTIA